MSAPPVPVNDRLRDAVLRRGIDRTRLETGCLRDGLKVWTAASRAIAELVRSAGLYSLRAGVVAELGLPDPSRVRRVDELLPAIRQVLAGAVGHFRRCLQTDLQLLAELELLELPRLLDDTTAAAVRSTLPETVQREAEEVSVPARPLAPAIGVTFQSVPELQIAQMLATPLGGAMFQASFADLEAATASQLRAALLGGLQRGEGVAKVARAIVGIMGNKRWQAERIVRSEFIRVANQAALVTFARNKDVLRGVTWISVLDARTCLRCGSLDGRFFADITKAPIPVVSTHPACRCNLSPVVKDADDLGLPPSTRASFNGQVPGDITYRDWFQLQDEAFQRKVLGPTRFTLWKAGQVKLGQFVSAAGIRRVSDVLGALKGRP